MDGIDAAVEAGLRVKINAVALKGVNDDEIHDMVRWCGDRGHDLTFIEVMPMGDLGNEDRLDQYWSLKDLRRDLETRWTLTDTPERHRGARRPLRARGRDRRANRLHHAADPQLLRKLQPGAG
jgi:GTP 3',8-cyclase